MTQVSAHSSETTHLLVNTASADPCSSLQQKRICKCPPSKNLCLPSKAAILIIIWTAVVGLMYYSTLDLAAMLVMLSSKFNDKVSEYHTLVYATLALVMMFYPLSGFIADVCCGRLKTVVVSLILLLIYIISFSLEQIVDHTMTSHHLSNYGHDQGILVVILSILVVVTLVVGLIGYQANIIQLGLDQLFEAPSHYLGLFIHHATWAFNLGSVLLSIFIPLLACSQFRHLQQVAFISLLWTVSLTLTVILVISCWKRRWFYNEPAHQNPYKTVYNVIKFVKNHKHPLRPSAFTYCDNYIPTRLDFAKERYGGPFTTEQVENVKTFFRILLILFAVGPVFSLEVPASFFFFPLFGMHSLNVKIDKHHTYDFCNSESIWKLYMATGSMKALMSTVITFPTYIWIVFSLLLKKMPKLFTRLGVGIVISFLGVISLLIIDVVGHSINRENTTNNTQCMFHVTPTNQSLPYPTLNMHWTVLIPPNILLGIGPQLVVATTFEFISAQSPQSMKGLLVGVFFAIRGLFQFLNSIIITPMSLKQPWASTQMIEHPPVTNCGFVYLLLTCVTGLFGLILFSLAAKRYKYRTRDEGMFRQQDVEEIYDRYISQASQSSDSSFN